MCDDGAATRPPPPPKPELPREAARLPPLRRLPASFLASLVRAVHQAPHLSKPDNCFAQARAVLVSVEEALSPACTGSLAEVVAAAPADVQTVR